MNYSQEQIALSAAHHNLLRYARLMFPDYKVSKHIKLIASALERVERGECKRLMISMPPRHGKSQLASEFFPAWYLGRNPDKYIITATYSQDLANDFGRKVRNQMLDPLHQMAFPDCRMVEDSKAKNKFNTTVKGVYYAVGVGASATGRGSHLLLIDDPLKGRKEAESEVMRQGLKDWYTSVAYTRLMPGGAVIIIQTRWHEDDLIGWVEKEHSHEAWEILKLPAIDESGTPLWPEQYPLDVLENIKRTIGSRDWEALYQQRPAASEGEIFKREWWQYYKEAPKLKWIIQSWDTAFKKGAENDYSVCHTWGVTDSGFYLLDRWKEKVEFPTLKRTVVSLANKWHPRAILIEDKASGQSLIQELKTNTTLPVLAIPVDSDKVTRAHAVTPSVEAGNCYLPEDATWLQDFIDEFATFPNGSHDDEVDATTQFLNYVRRRGEAAFKDFAEAAEKNKPKGHVWRPQEGTPYYRCDQCGIMVKVAPGQNANDVAASKGMAQCTPT
ncbi:MAG: phage terminase large subunit [Saccharofermentanales bacterium]